MKILVLTWCVLVILAVPIVIGAQVPQAPAPPPTCDEQHRWLVVLTRSRAMIQQRLEIEAAQEIARLENEIARLRIELAAAKKQ